MEARGPAVALVAVLLFGGMAAGDVLGPREAKLTAADGGPAEWYGGGVDVDGDRVIVGSEGHGDHGGTAFIYRVEEDGWQQEAELIADSDGVPLAFGRAVAIDGKLAVVGAKDENHGPGAAYVFEAEEVPDEQTREEEDGSDGDGAVEFRWKQVARLTGPGSESSGRFGWSVAIEGDRIAVGAPYVTFLVGSAVGEVYVFERRRNGRWRRTATLTARDGQINDQFGYSIALDGDLLAVGAPEQDLRLGAAYLFERRTRRRWRQIDKVVAETRRVGDFWGSGVALDDGTLAVAGDGATEQGLIEIFERKRRRDWSRQAVLEASDGQPRDFLGLLAVALFDGVLIAGGTGDADYGARTGSAYVFQKFEDGWKEAGKLLPADAIASKWYGFKVAYDGRRVAIGAYADDEMGINAGAAYVYLYDPVLRIGMLERRLDVLVEDGLLSAATKEDWSTLLRRAERKLLKDRVRGAKRNLDRFADTVRDSDAVARWEDDLVEAIAASAEGIVAQIEKAVGEAE